MDGHPLEDRWLEDKDKGQDKPPQWVWSGTESPAPLVANPETLCESVKHEARLVRRLPPPDVKSKRLTSSAHRLHKTPLQKDRVSTTLGNGRDPAALVRKVQGMREQEQVRLARRQFTRGLASQLSCNLGMVQRHMNMEDTARHRSEQQRAQANHTLNMRQRLQASHTKRLDQRDKQTKHRNQDRQARKRVLEAQLDQLHDDQYAQQCSIRENRKVLRLPECTSSIVEPAPEYDMLKSQAMKLSDLKRTIAEEQQRVNEVRSKRFAELKERKERKLRAHVPAVAPAASVCVDGSGVFSSMLGPYSGGVVSLGEQMAASTGMPMALSMDLSAASEFGTLQPQPMWQQHSQVSPRTSPAIVECKPPTSMISAARIFKTQVPKPPPPFWSSCARYTQV